MALKSSFYLKHDLDAREDGGIRALLIKLGARGYGIYWMVAEDLYRNGGRLNRDYPSLAWAYHEPEKDVRSVIEDFSLFYDAKGKIASRRVDRDLDSRREASERARFAGRSSAVQRALNAGSTERLPGEERIGEEGKDKTAAPSAADGKKLSTIVDNLGKTLDMGRAIDHEKLLDMRLPFFHGDVPKGRRVMDMSPADCKSVLSKHPRLSFDLTRALRYRVKVKEQEMAKPGRRAP